MKNKKPTKEENIQLIAPPEEVVKTIYLMEHAFLGLVVSSIEVYKKETMGLMVGTCHNGLYVAENAIAFQAAERHTNFVSIRGRYHDRITKFLSEIVHLDHIGYFHSHPGYEVVPSEEDVNLMQDGHVNVIVGINKKRKEVPWDYNVDGSLSGTIEGFYIKIRAHYRDQTTGRIRIARVQCPFAIGFRR